ncbi:MAG: hydroxyacylglutathione hydrolase [Panacagrimonas sp.]
MSTNKPRFELIPVPAFQDNYLWLLRRGDEAVVVDPGDAAPVEAALAAHRLKLVAVLITHHHPDHIGGLAALLNQRKEIPVHGPRREQATIQALSVLHDDGDSVEVLGRRFEVMDVPGHTLGHIAYYSPANGGEPPVLLCGDTLFSGGCGRLFEGTAEQMHCSLSRLAVLPGDTLVCCAHEYTASNLAFALAVEPGNPVLNDYVDRVRTLRAAKVPTLPSTIGLERQINPFLRTSASEVRDSAQRQASEALRSTAEIFGALRKWKDSYRPPTTAVPSSP